MNINSFVLYKVGESEADPGIKMPFLLSASCCILRDTIKTTWKSCHSLYLYDSPNSKMFVMLLAGLIVLPNKLI